MCVCVVCVRASPGVGTPAARRTSCVCVSACVSACACVCVYTCAPHLEQELERRGGHLDERREELGRDGESGLEPPNRVQHLHLLHQILVSEQQEHLSV